MSTHNGFAAHERQLTRGEHVSWQPGMDMRKWFPLTATACPAGGSPTLAWRDMQNIAFTDSFFENTLMRQPREQRRVCHTPPQALDQFQLANALAPDAFIFHVSRCGSTLQTQLLASLAQTIVMSEPPLIDSLLAAIRSCNKTTGWRRWKQITRRSKRCAWLAEQAAAGIHMPAGRAEI